jgi:hypothetical protein
MATYIMLLYCHLVRIGSVNGRWRSFRTASRGDDVLEDQAKSWRGRPERCESASSIVRCVVDQSFERTKSSGIILCTRLSHWMCGYFSLSSTRKETPAAVNALVVLPALKCVCSVTGLLVEMSETPKP